MRSRPRMNEVVDILVTEEEGLEVKRAIEEIETVAWNAFLGFDHTRNEPAFKRVRRALGTITQFRNDLLSTIEDNEQESSVA